MEDNHKAVFRGPVLKSWVQRVCRGQASTNSTAEILGIAEVLRVAPGDCYKLDRSVGVSKFYTRSLFSLYIGLE